MLYLKYELNKPRLNLDLDIELPSTGVTALFGQSGAGKTTILRIIAGLEPTQQGVLRFMGQVWQDKTTKIFIPPYLRKIGYVFQEGKLFNHLNIAKNLSFASSRSKIKKEEAEVIIEELGLKNLLSRMPQKLSGGEKQQVAFARCLLTQPDLLLLDEPFNAIDVYTTQLLIECIHKLQLPTLYVSHDRNEIIKIADYMLHIHDGKIITHGSLNQMLPLLGYNGFIINGKLISSNNGYCCYKTDIGSISFPTVKTPPSNARIYVDSRNINLYKYDTGKLIALHINSIKYDIPFYCQLNVKLANENIDILILKEKIANMEVHSMSTVFIEILQADFIGYQ